MDWQPGHRQLAVAEEEEEEDESAAEVGDRDHFLMQWRWKMAKQLEQDQMGEDRRTIS